MRGVFRPQVVAVGQRYVDDEVLAKPQPIPTLEQSLAVAFKRPLPQVLALGHERVRLNWKRP